jgi:hypothetical protein
VVDQRGLGPGTVRVGRFVGRLGVVGLPAMGLGLGLGERVVRRHVARLEAVGWLERTTGIRGEGSLVWLTSGGLSGVGLGQLRAVRAPAAFSVQTMHSIQVAGVAAELEHGGLQWLAVRELTLDRERWAVEVANERGGTSRRLPDLVAWPSASQAPVAIVLEHSQPHHHKRLQASLEGWQAAIREGRYAQVRYQTDPVTARQLERLAAQLGLTASAFLAVERLTADMLVAPAAVKPDTPTTAAQTPPAPVSVPPRPPPAPNPDPRLPAPQEPADTPPPAAGPQRNVDEVLHELLGTPDPKPRRRWRRQARRP